MADRDPRVDPKVGDQVNLREHPFTVRQSHRNDALLCAPRRNARCRRMTRY